MEAVTSTKFIDAKGNVLPSKAHLQTALLLDSLSLDYKVVEKDGRTVFVTERGDVDAVQDIDAGLAARQEQLKTIQLSHASLNFDYAHFLPSSPKCSVLHGHSSRVVVEITGVSSGDMILEFGEAKNLIKNVLSDMDHKLIVCRKYVKGEKEGRVYVDFEGRDGLYSLQIPSRSVYIIDAETTVENISEHIASRLASAMPRNIRRVSVMVYEGFGKSATSIG